VLAGALRQARPHGTALQVKDCDAVSGTHKLDIRGNPVPADVWGAKTVSCALTCSVLGSVAVCRLLPREVPALSLLFNLYCPVWYILPLLSGVLP